MAAGNNFSVTFIAEPEVSVTLLDEKGAVLGTNLAGKHSATDMFRTIYVKRDIPAKTMWKLKIENTSRRQTSVLLRVSTDANAAAEIPAAAVSSRAHAAI